MSWKLVQKALDDPEIHSTYIEGWAGIGKTWAAMHFGRIQSGLFLCTLTDDMSASDLRGCWMPHGNGLEWHDGPVTLAMKRGARLVLNELPHASAETIDFLHPIIESRETAAFMLPSNELVRPAPGFNVVATGNQPLESLPFALRDRFDACLRVTRPHPDALGRLRPQLREAAQRTTVLEEERRLSVRSWLVLERLMDRWDLRDACTVVFGAERGVQVYEALVLAGEVEPLVERAMAVPFDLDPGSVRRHEMAHVRFSPPTLPRVRFDRRLMAAVEDARINLALEQRGLPVELDADSAAQVRDLLVRDAARGDVFALVVRGVAAIGTGASGPLDETLTGMGRPGRFTRGCIERAARRHAASRRRSGGEIAPIRSAVRIARELARELRAAHLLDEDGRSRSRLGLEGWSIGAGSDPGSGLDREAEAFADGAGGPVPGTLQIVRAPLTLTLRRGRGTGRGHGGARRRGSVVRYPERWIPDRSIFRGRRRADSASVLVDTSGSMSLAPDDLDALLRATPRGARVAIYSGREATGELRIVARGARRAADAALESFGPGNIVDVPALDWLARQPAPRLWISDGGVTGVGDRPGAGIRRRCRDIQERAGIERVTSVVEALVWLSGRAVSGAGA